LLLDAKTNFLPFIELPDSVFNNGPANIPDHCEQYNPVGEIAHKLLKLETLVFVKLLETRIFQHGINDYVLYYKESELPITTKPIYEWFKLADIRTSVYPELSFLCLQHKRDKTIATRFQNLHNRLSPKRPLSPNPNGNGTLLDDMLNDDSCGELFDSESPRGGSVFQTPKSKPLLSHDKGTKNYTPRYSSLGSSKTHFISPSNPLWQKLREETSYLDFHNQSKLPLSYTGKYQSEFNSFIFKPDHSIIQEIYLQNAFPSLYLSKSAFFAFVEKYLPTASAAKLFSAFNLHFHASNCISYSDFCTFTFLTNRATKILEKNIPLKTHRAYFVFRHYSADKRKLTESDGKNVFNNESDIQLNDFIDQFVEDKLGNCIEDLMKYDFSILEETKKRNLSETSIPEMFSEEAKRVRFNGSDLDLSLSFNAATPSPLTDSNRKPKLKYRIAQHCVTCNLDGSIAPEKTELIYGIGRDIDELDDMEDRENVSPENKIEKLSLRGSGQQQGAIPLNVALKMHKKTKNVQQIIGNDGNVDNNAKVKMLAARQLTEGSFKHFQSVMNYNNCNSAPFQLMEGLRYFEKRKKANMKGSFTWDDVVNMESFGQCAIELFVDRPNKFFPKKTLACNYKVLAMLWEISMAITKI